MTAPAPGSTGAAGDEDVVDAEIVDEDKRRGHADMSDQPHDPSSPQRAVDEADEANGGPVIRDKRRIDPETGALRHPGRRARPPSRAPATPGCPAPGPPRPRPASPSSRRSWPSAPTTCSGCRPSTPTTAGGSTATASWSATRRWRGVLTELLPVLDDIDRAREHDDLDGAVQGGRRRASRRRWPSSGSVRYGEVGDPFDPQVHEALMHSHSPEVTETTCVQVLQPGYRMRRAGAAPGPGRGRRPRGLEPRTPTADTTERRGRR